MRSTDRREPACVPFSMVLETTDPEAGTAFYSALVDWNAQPPRVVAAPWDRWITVFATTDLARVRERAETSAIAVGPGPAGEDGIWLTDRAGAGVCVVERDDSAWQPRLAGLAQAELIVWNVAEARVFCRDVLGIESEPLADDPEEFHVLFAGDRPVAGLLAMANLYPAGIAAHWLPYLGVVDCDQATAVAVELGGRVLVAPSDSALGRYAIIQDPQGATVGLMRPVVARAYEAALTASRAR